MHTHTTQKHTHWLGLDKLLLFLHSNNPKIIIKIDLEHTWKNPEQNEKKTTEIKSTWEAAREEELLETELCVKAEKGSGWEPRDLNHGISSTMVSACSV